MKRHGHESKPRVRGEVLNGGIDRGCTKGIKQGERPNQTFHVTNMSKLCMCVPVSLCVSVSVCLCLCLCVCARACLSLVFGCVCVCVKVLKRCIYIYICVYKTSYIYVYVKTSIRFQNVVAGPRAYHQRRHSGFPGATWPDQKMRTCLQDCFSDMGRGQPKNMSH